MKTLADIAAALPGFDPGNLRPEHASAFIAQLARPVAATESLPLPQALGRVLARDVAAPHPVPPHDNAAMDGYAFDGAALRPGQPLMLRVTGTALAGKPWADRTAPGECVRAMTGAVMPPGLNTVVPQEQVAVQGGCITIPPHAVRPGDHRRRAGEDLARGQTALSKGELLAPAALGLAASLGLETLSVTRRLRVALLSTGDEIMPLGEPLRAGAVYDSNRYALHGLLARLGVEVLPLGAVPDRPEALAAALRQAADAGADAILTSGGMGAGDADHTRRVLAQVADMAFWQLAIRPGRPFAVGRMHGSGCLLFGLPGNPVAAMVAFTLLVRPALLRMMGARVPPPLLLRARMLDAFATKRPGRTEYPRGIASTAPGGRLQVQTTGPQGSALLGAMARANCLIVLPHDGGPAGPGDEVDVMLFDGVM
ncbi:MAG: molybdopterin molybdotransferase MoeA [Acidovorax sp.]